MPTIDQRSIEFLSDGVRIRGTLFTPMRDINLGKKHPIVVLGHGFGGLKEWAIPETAEALAEAGITGLSFDYRNFGDSEGLPREEVSHLDRLRNWQDAITYALSLPEVDPQRLGIWGTSLGGRDVLAIAAIDRWVKAALAQALLVHWTEASGARMAGFGDDIENFRSSVARDSLNRMAGNEPQYVPFVRASGDDAKREFVDSLSSEEGRNYHDRITLQSYSPTVLTDVSTLVPQISPTPMCLVLMDDDALPGQKQAYELAKEPKLLVTLKGHHFSPYTTSKLEAIQAAKDWFLQTFETGISG